MRSSWLVPVALLGIGVVACEVHVGKDPKTPAPANANAAPAPAAAPPAPTTPAAKGNPVRTVGKPKFAGSAATVNPPGTPVPSAPATVTPPPAGPPIVTTPILVGSNVFGSGTAQDGAFKGTIFFIPETSTKFPDLSTIKPAGVLYTKELNISPRNFQEGFPGVDTRYEWFAIRYESPLVVATEGDYQFRIVSDDGANIYIDNTLILENDGIHPPTEKKGAAHLVVGTHQIRLDYWQGPKFQIALQAFVTPPKGAEKLLGTTL